MELKKASWPQTMFVVNQIGSSNSDAIRGEFELRSILLRRSLSLLAIHGIATLEHPCSLKTAQRKKQNAKCESKDNEMTFKF